MKERIDGIVVVEGKTDVAFLSSFLDTEFVITNGSEISEKTIDYLKKSSEKRDIFVLTDPDFPGKKIRDTLDLAIPNLKHCFVSKENSIKHNKVGVAESTKEEVLLALKNYLVIKKNNTALVSTSDLYRLGLIGKEDSSQKRMNLSNKLHLGFCNAKTFLQRLNSSNISIKELEESL